MDIERRMELLRYRYAKADAWADRFERGLDEIRELIKTAKKLMIKIERERAQMRAAQRAMLKVHKKNKQNLTA